MLGGEQGAGAAEAGGDLVEDQQQPVLVATARRRPAGTRASRTTSRPRPARRARRSPPPVRARGSPPAAAVREVAPWTGAPKPPGGRGRRTAAGHGAGEQRVHPVTGSQTDIAPERVAVVAAAHGAAACAGRPRARWYCRQSLIATSTDTEPESAKNTCSSPAARARSGARPARTAGSWVSPPNITCAIGRAARAARHRAAGGGSRGSRTTTTTSRPPARARRPAAGARRSGRATGSGGSAAGSARRDATRARVDREQLLPGTRRAHACTTLAPVLSPRTS